MTIASLCVGLCAGPATAGPRETLRVTVGEATLLSTSVYQNRATVAVSCTGVVAAFYQKPDTGPRFYRISADGARTWGAEMEFPPQSVSFMSVGLRTGGVLFMTGCANPVKGGKPGELEASRIVFSDDFKTYELGTSPVSIPDAALNTRWATFWPPFDKGKIVQLPNGDLLAPMYGNFTGDAQYRVMLVRSADGGKSWSYHDTVAYDPNDPNPELFGAYCGHCEPSLALLADGRLLCAMRTQGAELAAEYRPIYLSWSDTQGRNWSKPEPTDPHLENIWPTLAVLDNGVVACQYGRPGVHVAFSLDNGHTWQDRVSFSNLPEPTITGQGDIVKVGPNRLLAIGNDATGTKVWPITVDRVKVRPALTRVQGRVLDEKGQPVAGARVELGPNRYTADTWEESDTFDHYGLQRLPVAPPALGYRAIATDKRYPVVTSDGQGRFEFKKVKRAEYVLTVEADGFAPQWRHINAAADPQLPAQEFQMKPGKAICSRVVDQTGKAVGGACVVLDKRHLHADADGRLSWAIEAPPPDEVNVRVYKRYSDRYKASEARLSPAQIGAQPIVLPCVK
jgi:hypothetical protein